MSTQPPPLEAEDQRVLDRLKRRFSESPKRRDHLIQNRFISNLDDKLVYCPIEKNSTTSLKHAFVRASGRLADFEKSGKKVHQYINQNRSSFDRSIELLNDPESLSFVVIRDPIDRIVSAFVNKFIHRARLPFVIRAIRQYNKLTGKSISNESSLSFRQLVELSANSPNRLLDVHWRPQVAMLGMPASQFSVLVPLSRLTPFMEFLEQTTGKSLRQTAKKWNVSSYSELDIGDSPADIPAGELVRLNARPPREQLVDASILESLRQRYNADIALHRLAKLNFENSLHTIAAQRN